MKSEAKVLLISTLVGIAALAGIIVFANNAAPLVESQPVDPAVLVRQNSHQTNTAPLKVTMVEFGDYQCPACYLAHLSLKAVLKDYNNSVNFVYRNFPLSQHANAMIAARAAEAAADQGKFWEMHDKLYETQQQWQDLPKPDDTFISYAKDLGLNADQFKSDIASTKYDARINADRADGIASGVNSTPTFYINNLKFKGALSYGDFVKAIEEELKK